MVTDRQQPRRRRAPRRWPAQPRRGESEPSWGTSFLDSSVGSGRVYNVRTKETKAIPRQKSTHVDNPKAVGTRLRDAREAAGLSQRQLSFQGCSPAYISRIEAGDR